jgi:hypothetical protein
MKRIPKSTKANHSHVPRPQQERIVSKFIQGRGIRQIARDEGRSRETVAKIVRSEDVQNYIAQLRESYLGLGREALAALTRVLKTNRDGKLAHQILVDIGVISNQRAGCTVQGALEMDEETRIQLVMGKLVQAAAVRAKVYGFSMGQLGRDLKAAGLEI